MFCNVNINLWGPKKKTRETLLCYFFVGGSAKTMQENRRKKKKYCGRKSTRQQKTSIRPEQKKTLLFDFPKCQWSARRNLDCIFNMFIRWSL